MSGLSVVSYHIPYYVPVVMPCAARVFKGDNPENSKKVVFSLPFYWVFGEY